MKQYKIFDEQIIIPGLKYLPEYISAEDELQLISFIDSMLWNCQLKRRTKQYGYQYDYKAKMVSGSKLLGHMHPLLESMCERLYSDGVFSEKFDQIIVNEYLPGQGIAAHIDCAASFASTVCSLSLASSCMMNLTRGAIKHEVLLERASLLVLQDAARYEWKYSIAPRKSDNGVKRGRRLSLTFRKVCF